MRLLAFSLLVSLLFAGCGERPLTRGETPRGSAFAPGAAGSGTASIGRLGTSPSIGRLGTSPSIGRLGTSPSSAGLAPSPSISASDSKAIASLAPFVPLDVTKTKTASLAWRVEAEGVEPIVSSKGVWALGPKGRFVLLVDPTNGNILAQTEVPKVVFTRLHRDTTTYGENAGSLLLISGYVGDKFTLTSLEPEVPSLSGKPSKQKVLWHRVDVPGEVSISEDGRGALLSDRTKCVSTPIDGTTGKALSAPLPDSLITMHEAGDTRVSTMCRRQTQVHVVVGGVSLVSHGGGKGRKPAFLEGFRPGGSAYRLELGQKTPRLVGLVGDFATFLLLSTDDELESLQVHVPTGRVVFRNFVARCKTGTIVSPYAEMVVEKGSASLLFARLCESALLLDLNTGKQVWSRSVGNDPAFLSGVPTRPWDKRRETTVGADAKAIHFFDLTGRLIKKTPIPSGARDVYPTLNLALFTSSSLDGAGLYDDKLEPLWKVGVGFGNAWLEGQYFVFLESSSTRQVVVEVATGTTFLVTDTLPWLVGAVKSPKGLLWVTSQREKDYGKSYLSGLLVP